MQRGDPAKVSKALYEAIRDGGYKQAFAFYEKHGYLIVSDVNTLAGGASTIFLTPSEKPLKCSGSHVLPVKLTQGKVEVE